RTDEYGGSFENRTRLTLDVASAVRAAWPPQYPLFVRISTTDWAEGGWTPDESVELARSLKARGVDLIDCSSGGLVPGVHIPLGPGYRVPSARRVRHDAEIAPGAVGLIPDAHQAEQIVASGDADLVFMGREFLRQPHWPLLAAHELGAAIAWPKQYERA